MRTIRHATKIVGVLLTATVMQACSDGYDAPSAPTDVARNGATAAAAAPRILRAIGASGTISDDVAQLQGLLGATLNATPDGADPNGRREINWDAVPPALTNTDAFPGDFFNATDPAAPAGRKRGAIFTTAGTGLRVSDNDFNDVNPTYGAQFNFFSPVRTFSSVGSNVLDVLFQVPGTDTPALVNGFGAIFSDVDRVLTTKLEYYDASNRRIGVVFAPRRTDANGHSVAGIVYTDKVVARVRMTLGNAALGPNESSTRDAVIVDDFLYGEPRAR
jgi:hypothetical protein